MQYRSPRAQSPSISRRTPWCALWIAAVLAALPTVTFAWGPQTIVVSPTPGNPAQSGNDFLAAVATIPNNNWGQRYLVQLEAGVYDLGTQSLHMKPWVDIAGTGIESTFVFGDGNTSDEGLTRGLVHGADNAELRALTIRVFPKERRNFLLPILNEGTSPRLRNLRLQAFGGEEYCGGITGFGTESWIEDVHIRSTCSSGLAIGIALDGATEARPQIREVDISVKNTGTSGWAWGILTQAGTAPSYIRDSQVTASGGTEAVGFILRHNYGALPGASIAVSNSRFKGNGASRNYGIQNTGALSLSLDDCTIEGSGPGVTYGIDNQLGFGHIDVRSSRIAGNTTSAAGNSPFGLVMIGASQISGGPSGAGVTCAGTYDETYTFFPGACPP